tara:strand:- start:616 stop:942 length:327 start_codon:yes stop_codon:yes gene_type:complete
LDQLQVLVVAVDLLGLLQHLSAKAVALAEVLTITTRVGHAPAQVGKVTRAALGPRDRTGLEVGEVALVLSGKTVLAPLLVMVVSVSNHLLTVRQHTVAVEAAVGLIRL